VLHMYAGVRALYDDGAARAKDATRDYRLMLDRPSHAAPLLTVYGGKITTYRRLAEAALRMLHDCLCGGPAWTATAPLPGGDFVVDGVGTLVARARRSWPFLTEPQAERLVGAYGTRLARVLGEARREDEIAPWFGADLSSAEVRYLMKYEWARTADDVLWRRSKLGLTVSEADRNALARFMQGAVERASA
jgi:glycerol-3-phosphate dehydrogenase